MRALVVARSISLFVVSAVAMSIALCGCSLPISVVPDPTEQLAECAGDADISNEILLATDFEASVHELVTCGNLDFLLVASVIESALVVAGEPSELPSAFGFADGTYTTGGTGVNMEVQFFASNNTPGFDDGDLIENNLFDPDNYLEGSFAVRDGDEVTLTFSGTGPLVSLLGKGNSPTSPLVLTDTDLSAISVILGTLTHSASIEVDDEREETITTYHILVPESGVGDMLASQSSEQNVQSVSAVRKDSEQELTTTDWNIAFINVSQTIEGNIDADVRGGAFDYAIKITFDGITPNGIVNYSCLESDDEGE